MKTWKKIAYEVLEKNGKPMSIREITLQALKIRDTEGKTLEKTIRTELYRGRRVIVVRARVHYD